MQREIIQSFDEYYSVYRVRVSEPTVWNRHVPCTSLSSSRFSLVNQHWTLVCRRQQHGDRSQTLNLVINKRSKTLANYSTMRLSPELSMHCFRKSHPLPDVGFSSKRHCIDHFQDKGSAWTLNTADQPQITREHRRSPQINRRSPQITPEHRRSPQINRRSPQIIPEHRTSPQITREHRRSPQITLNTADQPQITPEHRRSTATADGPEMQFNLTTIISATIGGTVGDVTSCKLIQGKFTSMSGVIIQTSRKSQKPNDWIKFPLHRRWQIQYRRPEVYKQSQCNVTYQSHFDTNSLLCLGVNTDADPISLLFM